MKKTKQGLENHNPIQQIINKLKIYGIKRLAVGVVRSIAWYLKCYRQFWRLPNIIEGYQYKLSAHSMWAEHYKKIAINKAQQVEDIMAEEVVELLYLSATNKPLDALTEKEKNLFNIDVKEKYERWDLTVPSEYLTNDEAWDRAERNHENWLASGGVGDFDHIYWNQEQGNELLGGFDAKK